LLGLNNGLGLRQNVGEGANVSHSRIIAEIFELFREQDDVRGKQQQWSANVANITAMIYTVGLLICPLCFDAVGWATGRASVL